MNNLILTVKEASNISDLPESFIRAQINNRVIPYAYFVQHESRKSYVIYKKPFMDWLEELRGDIL